MIPKVSEVRPETFRTNAAPPLVISQSLAGDQTTVWAPLVKALESRFGSLPAGIAPTAPKPKSPYILIGTVDDDPALEQLVLDLLPADRVRMHREGFVIDAAPDRVLIAAGTPAGAFYGVQALLETMSIGNKGIAVACGRIADWPTMARRGIHFLVKSRNQLPDFESIITEYMPRFRMNEIILEVNYHFEFQSHPEVREAHCWTVEDCRRLKALADANCVKIIPMINCLGHQSWADETFQLLKAHPEFDETPEVPLSNKEIYCRSWCPLHPDVNALVFDLIDEVVDVFEAESFHAGMDEVFILGRCPRCREYSAAELFARSVKDIHAHVVGERGLEMLIWGDRMIDSASTGYGEWEASANHTTASIDMIPKDIVICDWHYETSYGGVPATYPSVREFQRKGFNVWPAGWKSAQNARGLASIAITPPTEGIVGYLATTWTSIEAVAGGLRGDKNRLSENYIAGIVDAIHEGSRIAWEGTAEIPSEGAPADTETDSAANAQGVAAAG